MLRRLAALVVVSRPASRLLVLSGGARRRGAGDANKLRTVDHIVVIYEENHSFDNLYGGWERVRGLSDADAAHTTQLGQTGPAFAPTSASTRTTRTCRRSRRRTRRRR
jgi:phospholipase C